MTEQRTVERPDSVVIHAMREVTDAIAQMAEDRAGSWKNAPGDVTLQSFAQAIRKANRELLSDG